MILLNMDMPSSCANCRLLSYGRCTANDKILVHGFEKPSDCPLKEYVDPSDTRKMMSEIHVTKNLSVFMPFSDCNKCYNYDPEITSYEETSLSSDGYCYEHHTVACRHADACMNLYHRKCLKEVKEDK